MRNCLIALAALSAAAAPAAAQSPAYDAAGDRYAAELNRAIPEPHEIEAMTHGLDRMLGALLTIDVGPLLDAADPYGVRARGERTLGEVAGGEDPYFEDRLRSDLYETSSGLGRMMEAFATVTPSLARSLEELEREIEAAAGAYRGR